MKMKEHQRSESQSAPRGGHQGGKTGVEKLNRTGYLDRYSRKIRSPLGRLRNFTGVSVTLLATLLVITALLSSGCRGEDYRPELNAIRDRLKRLEEKMEQMEYRERKIARLEDQIREMKKSLEKYERAPTRVLAQERYHTVRKGETLSGIAKRYGMSVEEVCGLNGISPKSIIRPGQRLLISPVKR